MKQDDLQKALEALAKGGVTVAGDLVLEKHVEYEVNNVENGGIGIQINNGRETPLTQSDKDIKSAIEELLKATDEKGALIFKNKKQWWAVYRVLFTFCNYPLKMTAFREKMKELEVTAVDGQRAFSYESLRAAPKDVPQLATCSPSAWNTMKDINENYNQQFVVADFLMLKLGIKS